MSAQPVELWSNDLVCHWRSVAPIRNGIRIDVPESCCTDMGGAIRFALALDPEASVVDVYAGGELDTRYMRSHGGPRAYRFPSGLWEASEYVTAARQAREDAA